MPRSSFSCLIVGSSLLLLISADVVSAGPTPLSSSSGLSRPLLDVPLGIEEHEAAQLGLMENSQESSGFFSEDGEDNKVPRAARQWGVQGEVNTSLDADSLIGYNPSHPRLSSLSLRKEPKEVNTSAFFVSVAEPLDPERWESDSETSGFPLHPSSSSLSTTAAGPLTHTTVTEFKQNGPQPEATAAHDAPSLPEDEERQNLLTQAPTVPEVGPFPSQTPLQPDDTRRDDAEDQEEEEEEEEEGDEEMVAFPTEVDGEEDDDWTHLTVGPTSTPPSEMPAVAFTQMAWQDVEVTRAGDDEEAELRHGGTEYLSEADLHDSQEVVQVICVDWSDLAGKGYVILNMSDNYDCEEFRMESGDRLLEMLESAFSRKMNSPQGSWLISLSKPSRQERQLLMTLASEQGVIATKDVLSMLGEMRRGLYEIGIQNFSSVSTCHSRPSQTRSDYGKLFVVLVIIGSVCGIIIASGLIYICWQRRLPKMKNMSRGEELHFVENGCHDNPTLDVTSDGQSEMQEKKHSANGVPVGGGGGSGWQVLVNKPGKEEEDNQEEDTHL
ncbi:hypothetical protein AOLI_G00246950 [Acnodon oligacanthus]